ncbi:hypothetical protein ES319_A13G167100v1 [Gossypium barbadense]|uniref:KIB1-4 beta-propeller domain-containing protein n=1 Tax=Gossypium barbadense TaxID=3634 RepID=A0A5J5T6D4_GOSBA|nr:hypothetical protein ES319_A13G167100v1 [Gossypium barbadense]
MGNSVPDWEYLPKLCLLTVFEKIDEPISLVQFGAVSKYWHSLFNTFLDIKRRSSTNLVPMLMIPLKKSATKRKIYSLQAKSKIAEIEFPKPYTWRYCGSCYGWLATVDESFNITLSNPFENLSIRLPQFDSMAYDSGHYTYKILKVVLSEDPLLHPNNFVVVVIYSVYGRLAFYRPCQENWIYMDVDEDQSLFLDILFHKGLVYAIGHYNNLVWFDVNGVEDDESSKPPKLNTLVPTILRLENYSHRAYLVRSSMGNLYSIHKHLKFEEKLLKILESRIEPNFVEFLTIDGFEYLKENRPSLQSELLKTVAGSEEEFSGGRKRQSVWAQFSDGGGDGEGVQGKRNDAATAADGNMLEEKDPEALQKAYSGRPGGMKVETFNQLRQRIPERIIEHAVRGMLPKGRVSSLV